MSCEHKTVRSLAWVSRAPLKDERHTAFHLMSCVYCGALVGFPDENFKLAIDQGTEETLRSLLKTAAKINELKIG
jgi:hypothetical protein